LLIGVDTVKGIEFVEGIDSAEGSTKGFFSRLLINGLAALIEQVKDLVTLNCLRLTHHSLKKTLCHFFQTFSKQLICLTF